MKKSLIGFMMFLVMFLFLGACSNESTSTDDNSNSNNSSEEQEPQNAQGVTDTEILIGNWTAHSGSVAQFAATAHGAEAYFNKINEEEGGVNGRKIKFITLDDQYEPSKTVAAAKRLIEQDKVFALVSAMGTAGHDAARPLVESTGIPTLPHSGASQFVDPPIKNYFGIVSNYAIEAGIFAEYLDETLNVESVGVFYQNDDVGHIPYEVVKEEFDQRGVEIVEAIEHGAADVDYSSAAIKMHDADPDAILAFTNQTSAASFWEEYKGLGGDAQYVTQSSVGQGGEMFELVGDVWEGTIGVDAYHSLDNTDEPKVQEFLEEMEKQFPNANPDIAKIGWSAAQITVEALKRSGDDLSWDNFISQMETLENWKGSLLLNVNYSPDFRYGPTGFHLTEAKDGKAVVMSDLINYEAE